MRRPVQTVTTVIFLLNLLPLAVMGQPLPPELPWNGETAKFIRPADDPWVTPAEVTGLTETPNYAATISWLRKLVEASPQLTMQTIGKTWQQRDLWLVVATDKAAETPEQLPASKPTLLFHAGIHAGEIDGKDAGLMFLRDVVQNNTALLDKINILFIPVLSPDAHENSSAFNRVNQRGPKEMGWRTNARNLNLNRDFAKAETPEIQALLQVFNRWPVDLYIDVHVTDGIDYQHDITFGFNDKNPYSPRISRWLAGRLTPAVYSALTAAGHVPGPLLLALDDRNFEAGILSWTAPPRFSNGYGDARHLPAILVENHSLKSYKQRVLGTYVFLNSVAAFLADNFDGLREAAAQDRHAQPNKVPMGWQWDPQNYEPHEIKIKGVAYKKYTSPISGTEETEWLGTPQDYTLPHHVQRPRYYVTRPAAYWVPASRADIIAKLQLHGLQMEILEKPASVNVELYRLDSSHLATTPFEGRVRLEVETASLETQTRVYAAGSARIPTDQPLGDLAILLLEPFGEDSFLQWGYFHEILQRTEYIEGYVVEPLAQSMLNNDRQLKKAFEKALTEEAFAKDPKRRLQWFYERSPYWDPNYLLYPVGREM